MASNKPAGDGQRQGSVRKREQIKNPRTDHFTKIDAETGRFMDNKAQKDSPFKGVRKK